MQKWNKKVDNVGWRFFTRFLAKIRAFRGSKIWSHWRYFSQSTREIKLNANPLPSLLLPMSVDYPCSSSSSARNLFSLSASLTSSLHTTTSPSFLWARVRMFTCKNCLSDSSASSSIPAPILAQGWAARASERTSEAFRQWRLRAETRGGEGVFFSVTVVGPRPFFCALLLLRGGRFRARAAGAGAGVDVLAAIKEK